MLTTRRDFIRQLTAAGVVSIAPAPPVFLRRAAQAAEQQGDQSTAERILVLVELAGGNDGLNTVIPYGDEQYYKLRPGLSISRGEVLKIDDHVGLHPRMTGLKELYDESRLAIVQGIGYPRPNRSHFKSMDIWHSGRTETEDQDVGWLGRALDRDTSQHVGKVPALALGTEKVPLALVGAKVNVPLVGNLDEYRLNSGGGPHRNRSLRRKLIGELARGSAPAGSELDFLKRTATAAFTSARRLEEISAAYTPAAPYPEWGIAQRLKTVAQIIAGDLSTRIFFVSLGGFDTHSRQRNVHAFLLEQVSSAIRAFYLDLKGHGLDDRVVLATYSEFGRRAAENGSLGTDHGAASQMLIVTPTGKGGVYGKHPSLSDLFQGDLKFHTDFRSVYATLLERWLGCPSEPVLGGRFAPLEFV